MTRRTLIPAGLSNLEAMLALAEGHAELARARFREALVHARASGDAREAAIGAAGCAIIETDRELATRSLAEARALADRWTSARSARGRSRARGWPESLRIDTTLRTFCVGNRAPVNLRRRDAPWRVLLRLASAHRAQADVPVSVGELIETGWPGQKLIPEAAAGRVYFVIRQLRKMGLEGHIVTAGGGYLIATTTAVTVEPPPVFSDVLGCQPTPHPGR
jgi:hypothetical protein